MLVQETRTMLLNLDNAKLNISAPCTNNWSKCCKIKTTQRKWHHATYEIIPSCEQAWHIGHTTHGINLWVMTYKKNLSCRLGYRLNQDVRSKHTISSSKHSLKTFLFREDFNKLIADFFFPCGMPNETSIFLLKCNIALLVSFVRGMYLFAFIVKVLQIICIECKLHISEFIIIKSC